MQSTFVHSLTVVIAIIVACGCLYALGAIMAVRRFARGHARSSSAFPSITLLKPLYGAESDLYDNLASFCNQDYPAPVQMLIGVGDSNDPAVPIVRRLIDDHPDRDIELVVNPGTTAANPKIANLIDLQRHIRHDVVVLSDSDIVVRPDYLARTIAALEAPQVGLATCLYRGLPERGVWAELASMAIDYHFLPNVLVGIALGLARPCFGSTIALRRETLDKIGGFHAFRDQLADDNAIGEAVRSIGLKVAIPSWTVDHRCTEQNASGLLRHELRWARTLRAVNPVGYTGLMVTYPLPFALLMAPLNESIVLSAFVIIVALCCRLALQMQVDHTLGVTSKRGPLGPARDLIAFGVYVASFFVNEVSWRGQRFKVRADGTLVPRTGTKT
jgi:ceramide glucosyltransferase